MEIAKVTDIRYLEREIKSLKTRRREIKSGLKYGTPAYQCHLKNAITQIDEHKIKLYRTLRKLKGGKNYGKN